MSGVRTRPSSWQAAFDLVKSRGYQRRDEPFMLASGQMSHDYIDGKFAVDYGDNLVLVATAVVDLAATEGIQFDAVGGLTMGADPLAIAVSIVAHKRWFSVRKQRKERGRNQWIEGTRFEQGAKTRVLLVDDVVTSGGSIMQAYEHVHDDGGIVTGVIPMVDRGVIATKLFADKGIPYLPLITYEELGIAPVDGR
ncbi:orotate phosphoribosyltransferase [Mycobacterium sp. 1100029.7]|nr:orotate phosphoribosyltransferase [Mycobacterium sp. 1100029.7]